MASNDPFNDNIDASSTDFFPMNVSSVKKKIHTNFPGFIPYFNLTCNILTFIIVSAIGIIILSVLNDAITIMTSGKTVLSDLNLIIPEIRHTLGMLTRLCEHPNFEPYCGLPNHTRTISKC